MNMDQRYLKIKSALSKLSNKELQRILDYPEEGMVYDEFNFDSYTKKY